MLCVHDHEHLQGRPLVIIRLVNIGSCNESEDLVQLATTSSQNELV